MENDQQIIRAAKRVPVVLGDRRMPNVPIDSVGTDNQDAMRRLVGRLARAGYSRIGYVSEDLIMSNCSDRYQGFLQGMAENGLPVEERWMFLRPELRLNKAEGTYRYFLPLERFRPLPQIFVCTSDLIAMGLIAALKAGGLHVPRDVGVVGFDDISIAAFYDPPLTTIAQDMRQLGRSCFQALLNRMEDRNRTTQDILVKAKIVVRDSVRL